MKDNYYFPVGMGTIIVVTLLMVYSGACRYTGPNSRPRGKPVLITCEPGHSCTTVYESDLHDVWK